MSAVSGESSHYSDIYVKTANDEFTFSGVTLGHGTSREQWHSHDRHNDDGGDAYAPRGTRCSACRWFEVTIYGVNPDSNEAKYLVVTRGPSIVPGEMTYDRVTWTDSPFEVIELLTIRHAGTPVLPRPSARALAQAATFDDEIRDAYENRAVL